MLKRLDERKPTRSALHGLARALVANMVHGGHRTASTRSSRSRASAIAPRPAGQGAQAVARLLAPRSRYPVPEGIKRLGPRQTPSIKHRGNQTSSSSASSPPTCVRCGRRSPTRARASATWASTSGARSARPARRPDRTNAMKSKGPEPEDEHTALSRRLPGEAVRMERSDPPPADGVSQREAHLRPAHRPRLVASTRGDGSPPARRRSVDGSGYTGNVEAAKKRGRRDRRRRPGRHQIDRTSCSTATASSTTAA